MPTASEKVAFNDIVIGTLNRVETKVDKVCEHLAEYAEGCTEERATMTARIKVLEDVHGEFKTLKKQATGTFFSILEKVIMYLAGIYLVGKEIIKVSI